jgi:hypothetical protein
VSLRRELHSAFDQIAPPLGGMPERVVQTVLAENKARTRKERMLIRFRTPLSLVAVFLVIALAGAVFVGGRLMQDFSSFHRNAPAAVPTSTPTSPPTATLAELEARPLTLPTLRATDPCPLYPGPNSLGYQMGDGPVYANGANPRPTAWGNYFYIAYYTARDLKGLVLIRGRDLRSDTIRVVFVGNYVTGPVIGNDAREGTQYGEAVLDASKPPARLSNGLGFWTVNQGLPKAASSCFGFQIDGTGFTEIITGGS